MTNIEHLLTPQVPSITGRDGYIELQALAYAITAIGMLPEAFQEKSNRRDMQQILDHFCDPRFKSDLLDNARAHLTGVDHDEVTTVSGTVVNFPGTGS